MAGGTRKEKEDSASSKNKENRRHHLAGVATGVGHWFQLYDEESAKYFYFNKATGKSSWGLPLVECVPSADRAIVNLLSPDWVCCIDSQSGKKFYQNTKLRRVQWTPPLAYRGHMNKLPYFRQNRVSMVGASRMASASRPTFRGTRPTSRDVKAVISIQHILDDEQACAAYHRFLLATHAEENILFWGATEVYRKGEWKGMKVLGEANKETLMDDDEGRTLLQTQMIESRASLRIGYTNKRMSLGKEARLIYEKFLKQGAPLEVCVNSNVAARVLDGITSRKPDSKRTLFLEAQDEVLRNMSEDQLPRFLQVALSEDDETVGSGKHVFQSDAVLKTALYRIAARAK